MRQYKRLTPGTFSRRISLGRGQGKGSSYKPMVTILDAVSYGISTRMPGAKTGRLHHAHNKLEEQYIVIQDWAESVVDIRESYPLDLKTTMEIANRIGTLHPRDSKTEEPVAILTSFLLTIEGENGDKYDVARCVIASNRLTESRLKTLEIERVYWSERNTDWGIVTEHMVNHTLYENLKWVRAASDLRDQPHLTPELLLKTELGLFEFVASSDLGLSATALEHDDALGWRQGTTLWLIRHFIWTRIWGVDMYSPIALDKPLRVLIRNLPKENVI